MAESLTEDYSAGGAGDAGRRPTSCRRRRT
jgi:hypothetical protein